MSAYLFSRTDGVQTKYGLEAQLYCSHLKMATALALSDKASASEVNKAPFNCPIWLQEEIDEVLLDQFDYFQFFSFTTETFSQALETDSHLANYYQFKLWLGFLKKYQEVGLDPILYLMIDAWT